MSTRTELLNGADFEGDEAFCDAVVNAIKNHFRASDPCTNMTDKQPGEILSDSDDDKLYHVGGESGYPCDEILQATKSCDVIPEFAGIDLYHDCASAYFQRIISSDAEGLAGADLRLGLDESMRTLIICDRGDLGVDYGLTAGGWGSAPTLMIATAAGGRGMKLVSFRIDFANGNYEINAGNSGEIRHIPYKSIAFEAVADMPSGDYFKIRSQAGVELTDTNAEQAWIYIEPKINQTNTAGYIGLLMDVTETNLGDASAGAGYNALLDLRVGGTTQFGIQNDGKVMTNQTAAATTLGNVTDKMPIYDGAGTLVGYIPIYDAIT